MEILTILRVREGVPPRGTRRGGGSLTRRGGVSLTRRGGGSLTKILGPPFFLYMSYFKDHMEILIILRVREGGPLRVGRGVLYEYLRAASFPKYLWVLADFRDHFTGRGGGPLRIGEGVPFEGRSPHGRQEQPQGEERGYTIQGWV